MTRFRRMGGYADTWMDRIRRYFVHLDLNFLFITGDPNMRHHDGALGELTLGLLPLLVWGTVRAWRRASQGDVFWTYVLAMAFLGLAPACFSSEVPQALHTSAAVIPFFVLCLLGISGFDSSLDSLRAWRAHWPAVLGTAFFALLSVAALGYHLDWYLGSGYAHASQKAWRSTDDLDRESKNDNAGVDPSDHRPASVFFRASKVAAGDLRYCNTPK
jgi:hypothetical protein